MEGRQGVIKHSKLTPSQYKISTLHAIWLFTCRYVPAFIVCKSTTSSELVDDDGFYKSE